MSFLGIRVTRQGQVLLGLCFYCIIAVKLPVKASYRVIAGLYTHDYYSLATTRLEIGDDYQRTKKHRRSDVRERQFEKMRNPNRNAIRVTFFFFFLKRHEIRVRFECARDNTRDVVTLSPRYTLCIICPRRSDGKLLRA